ncbi:MAG TPA: hypothetical protein EYN66_04395 [Myxococcales bacterium]|nr:hypothetical protein [Myxococcales bacterium]
MPGITANLSNVAFAIWEEVPRKTRRPVNSMGGPMEPGRSKWISGVIIDHHQKHQQFKDDLQFHIDEKLALMRKLSLVRESRDRLQEIVLGTDGPKP